MLSPGFMFLDGNESKERKINSCIFCYSEQVSDGKIENYFMSKLQRV